MVGEPILNEPYRMHLLNTNLFTDSGKRFYRKLHLRPLPIPKVTYLTVSCMQILWFCCSFESRPEMFYSLKTLIIVYQMRVYRKCKEEGKNK